MCSMGQSVHGLTKDRKQLLYVGVILREMSGYGLAIEAIPLSLYPAVRLDRENCRPAALRAV